MNLPFGSSQPLIPPSQINNYFNTIFTQNDDAQSTSSPQKRKRENSTSTQPQKRSKSDSIAPLISNTNTLLQQHINQTFAQLKSRSKQELSDLKVEQKVEILKMIRILFILGNIQEKDDDFAEAYSYLWYLLQCDSSKEPLKVQLFSQEYNLPRLEKFDDVNVIQVALRALAHFMRIREHEEALELAQILIIMLCANEIADTVFMADLVQALVDILAAGVDVISHAKRKYAFRLLIQVLSEQCSVLEIESSILNHTRFRAMFPSDKDQADFLYTLANCVRCDGGVSRQSSASEEEDERSIKRLRREQLKIRDRIYMRALKIYGKKGYHVMEMVDIMTRMHHPPNLLAATLLNSLESLTNRMASIFKRQPDSDDDEEDSQVDSDDDSDVQSREVAHHQRQKFKEKIPPAPLRESSPAMERTTKPKESKSRKKRYEDDYDARAQQHKKKRHVSPSPEEVHSPVSVALERIEEPVDRSGNDKSSLLAGEELSAIEEIFSDDGLSF